jgi:hypothetical protein
MTLLIVFGVLMLVGIAALVVLARGIRRDLEAVAADQKRQRDELVKTMLAARERLGNDNPPGDDAS